MKGVAEPFRKRFMQGFEEGMRNYPSPFTLHPSPFTPKVTFGLWLIALLPNPKTLGKYRASIATFGFGECSA